MGFTEFSWILVVLLGLYGFFRFIHRKPAAIARYAASGLIVVLLLFVPFEVSPRSQYDTARIAWRFWPTEMLQQSMPPISYNHLLPPWVLAVGVNWYVRRRQQAPKTVPPPPA